MVDEVLRSHGDTPPHALPDDLVGYGSPAAPWGFAARYIPQDLVGYWTDVIALTAGRTGVLLGCCVAEDRHTSDDLLSHARAELLQTADPALTLTGVQNRDGAAKRSLSALCAVIDGDTMSFSTCGQSAATLSSPGTAPVALTAATGGLSVSPLTAGSTVLMSTAPIRSAAALLGDCAGVHPEQLADRVIQGFAAPAGGAALLYRHPPEPLSITMPADPSSLAVSRALLREWLTAAGLDAEVAADVLLAVGEATANSTEHAVLGAPRPVEISLDARFGESNLQLAVTDNGCWKPAAGSPGHRGHGLHLMRALVDSVELTTDPQGTTVAMVKELPR